jgi:hypothetical protein
LRRRILLVLAAGLVGAAVASPDVRAREQAPPSPRQGVAVNIEPTSGSTFYRAPGRARLPLTAEIQVPVNTTVDATNGQMGITSANGAADFKGGVFVVREPPRLRVTQLFLANERFGACQPGSTAVVQQLWGSGKGHFQTRGRFAAATVRGTTWRVEDRCDGTLTIVAQGVVAVRDFRLRRTVLVRAGQSYLARR